MQTHYLRKIIPTGEVSRLPFERDHFQQVGIFPRREMPVLEAYQLVNKWNTAQSEQQRYVYALEQ